MAGAEGSIGETKEVSEPFRCESSWGLMGETFS